MQLSHINMTNDGRLQLARTETERRALVRAIVAAAPGKLIAFNLVDEHLHLLSRSDWPARLADAVRRVLKARRPDLDFLRPHVKPVESKWHLQNSLEYILRQTDHHQLNGADPATWTGSSFLDLAGARVLPGFDARVLRQELPRVEGRDLYPAVGLLPIELEPADDAALLAAGPAWIAQLAAAVVGADPAYPDRRHETVLARAIAAHTSRALEMPDAPMARYLGVGPRNVGLLVQRVTVEPRALRAVRVRHTLLTRVAPRAGARAPDRTPV